MNKVATYKSLLNFLIIGCSLLLMSCLNSSQSNQTAFLNSNLTQTINKINGISFVATRNPIDKNDVQPLVQYNANYVAVIPYAWMRSIDSPQVIYDKDHGWWGEKPHGVSQTIDLMNDQNIEVMLKPQIWINKGTYTGTIQLKTNEDWQILEDSYREYILRFARIAQEKKVGLFCIGTELESFVTARPDYWRQLIKEIRTIYKGKITYAGNWDSYKQVTFWDELDYIGVDAYFPVCNKKTPDIDNINQSWDKWKKELKSFSTSFKKQILFTEYGYISADYAGKEPWKNAQDHHEVNEKAQDILYQCLYDKVWGESWMAGGFLWKYHAEDSRWRGFAKRFTPQGKMAQKTITQAYLEH